MFEKLMFVSIFGAVATLAVVLSVNYLVALVAAVGIMQIIYTCLSVAILGALAVLVLDVVKEIAKTL